MQICVNEIFELKRRQKTLSRCLDMCSINCKVLPYLPNVGKLSFGLLHADSLLNKGEYPFNLEVIISI